MKLNYRNNTFLSLVFIFILVFGYFSFFCDYLILFQEKESLFIFDRQYCKDFLIKPGGLTVLAGKFITQFYYYPIIGALLLASVICSICLVFVKVAKNLSLSSKIPLIFSFIPGIFLLLMQTHYYHLMEYNLGALFVFLFFLLTLKLNKKWGFYSVVICFPFFFWIAGGFAWIFLGMLLMFLIFHETGTQRIVKSAIIIVIGILTFFGSKELLFYQPAELLISYPLPLVNDKNHRLIFILFSGYTIFFPLVIRIVAKFFQNRKKPNRILSILNFLVISALILLLFRFNNPQNERVARLENMVFNNQWNKAIDYYRNFPTNNMLSQHFYTIALSETNQLCDELFLGDQTPGVNSLILPWGNQNLKWGAYFYYSIGLFNEAKRWAYEEMVSYGYRPENIKLLIKTSIINGDYRMAKKYNAILRKSIFYKKWANQQQKLIDNPALIQNHAKYKSKIELHPQKDFFIKVQSPQNNILEILETNPKNKRAFEYKMAWLLLNKNVETIITDLKNLSEMGYTKIPVNLEEAILVYANSTGIQPNLGDLTISAKTQNRFNEYARKFKSFGGNKSMAKSSMKKNFGNTYWYYFHFK